MFCYNFNILFLIKTHTRLWYLIKWTQNIFREKKWPNCCWNFILIFQRLPFLFGDLRRKENFYILLLLTDFTRPEILFFSSAGKEFFLFHFAQYDIQILCLMNRELPRVKNWTHRSHAWYYNLQREIKMLCRLSWAEIFYLNHFRVNSSIHKIYDMRIMKMPHHTFFWCWREDLKMQKIFWKPKYGISNQSGTVISYVKLKSLVFFTIVLDMPISYIR